MNYSLSSNSEDDSSVGSNHEERRPQQDRDQVSASAIAVRATETDDDVAKLGRLFYTFKLERGGNEDDLIPIIMELMRKNPMCASRRFQHEPYSSSATLPVDPYTTSQRQMQFYPFSYLLIGGASADNLKEVYNMYPGVIGLTEKMPDKRHYWPIQTVCIHRFDEEEVVCFVANHSACEDLARVPSLSHGTSIPLHYALDRHAPLETIRILVDRNPNAILKQNSRGMDCLQRAMWSRSPSAAQIIHYLADKFPKERTDYRFDVFDHRMDLMCCQALAKLLPQLERFTCKPGIWTLEAVTYFLNLLRDNETIRDLELDFAAPTFFFGEQVKQYHDALREFFATNTQVVSCKIGHGNVDNGYGDDETLLSIQEGLVDKQKSNDNRIGASYKLCIGRLRLYTSSIPLVQMLSASNALTHLELKDMLINEDVVWGMLGPRSPRDATMNDSIHSNIQELKIISCVTSVKVFCDMLSHLAQMTKLRVLTLEDTIKTTSQETTLVTQALSKVIRGGTLRSLTALIMELDMKIILEALKGDGNGKNPPLTSICLNGMPRQAEAACLDVLEQHNTTIVHFKMISIDMLERTDFMAKAAYYTKLNEYGRGKIRSEHMPAHDFVDLLDSVATDDSMIDGHSVQYGLLRECPSIWCWVPNAVKLVKKRRYVSQCHTDWES